MMSLASERGPDVTDVWGSLTDAATESSYRACALPMARRSIKTTAAMGAAAFVAGLVPDYMLAGYSIAFLLMVALRLVIVAMLMSFVFIPALTATWVRLERSILIIGLLVAIALNGLFVLVPKSVEVTGFIATLYVLVICVTLHIHPLRSAVITVVTVAGALISSLLVHQHEPVRMVIVATLLPMTVLVALTMQVRLRGFRRLAFANYEAERIALERAIAQTEARKEAEALAHESDNNLIRVFEAGAGAHSLDRAGRGLYPDGQSRPRGGFSAFRSTTINRSAPSSSTETLDSGRRSWRRSSATARCETSWSTSRPTTAARSSCRCLARSFNTKASRRCW